MAGAGATGCWFASVSEQISSVTSQEGRVSMFKMDNLIWAMSMPVAQGEGTSVAELIARTARTGGISVPWQKRT